MTAHSTGTLTRKVHDLVKALGCDLGVSKSTVSRICQDIDEDVTELRTRRLDGIPFAYLWLDATYLKARENRRVVSKALVIAIAVRGDGHREIVGVDVGESENETFWSEFLRDLTDRGLTGVQLVISDAHRGLTATITRVMQGSAWQRCRVHAMREPLPPPGTSIVSSSPHSSGPCSPSPTTTAHAPSSTTSSPGSNRSPPRSRDASSTWPMTCSPTPRTGQSTGSRSGRTSPSNGSTARLNGAPTSSATSQTSIPSSDASAHSSSRSSTT
jgi:hypothetical protein